MASVVDICNIALSHLGDDATVTNIDPPEGSSQAAHCARYYPIARDTLLEMYPWSFATKPYSPAVLTSTFSRWAYAYAVPSDCIRVVSVLSAYDYVSQEFDTMTESDGTLVVYANVETPTILYTFSATDPTKFSPLFTQALTWHLASMLAGPVLKGDAGAAEGKRCSQMMAQFVAKASYLDASQSQKERTFTVPWMAGR